MAHKTEPADVFAVFDRYKELTADGDAVLLRDGPYNAIRGRYRLEGYGKGEFVRIVDAFCDGWEGHLKERDPPRET